MHSISAALQHDLERISELWSEGLHRFGGPFLAGDTFCAVDAFFAPVAFRIQTFRLSLDDQAMAYATHLLKLESMRNWYQAALQERWRERAHDKEISDSGTVIEDLRAAV
jgi:glutathione S-transferase